MNENDTLKFIMNSALKAALPNGKFKNLPSKPKGKLLVIGAGKAAASMAKAFEESYDGPLEGMVITRYGHSTKTKFIEVIEASHPEPDDIGLSATKKLFELAKKNDVNDHVVFLISGGASSLLTLPADGINFVEKQRINKELLISGAPIDKMNIVRRAFSKIKGGRLAEVIYPAKLTTYMISDIPGDDPSYIGSGPTIQATGSNKDAIKILNDYKIHINENLKEVIIKNQLPKILNSPTYMIASPMMALKSAYNEAKKLGIKPIIISDSLEGEARLEGKKMAKLALKIKKEKKFEDTLLEHPILLLSGGETTVTVKGNGKGGRNTEFMLSMAIHLKEANGITALSIDTDGIDGVEDNAGAFISDQTLKKAKSKNLQPQKFLDNNDSYSFFKKIDDLIFTKPTLTNVNDFRAVLIQP